MSHRGHPKVLQYIFFHQKLPSLASYSSAHPIQDLLPCEKPSYCGGSAPQYLKACCIPASSISSWYTLRSSALGHLVVRRTRTSMTQSRGFAIVEQIVS